MAQVALFHHVQGLTEGVKAFADALRAGGHVVTTPDLFDGQTFASIEEGFAYTNGVGEEVMDARTAAAVEGLPDAVVFAGFSFGVMTAQRLAQTRPGALGALLYDSFVSVTEDWAFGPWPAAVPVQVHGMDADPFFALEGDIDAARELVRIVGPEVAQLYVYPGDQHLFADSSLPSYDAGATALVIQRSLELLARV